MVSFLAFFFIFQIWKPKKGFDRSSLLKHTFPFSPAAFAAGVFISTLPHHTIKAKPRHVRGFVLIGGQSGIRTHGTLWGYTRFPIVHLRPLGHLSNKTFSITFFFAWQALFSIFKKYLKNHGCPARDSP